MSTIVEAILESWDRQTTIFRNLANSITPELSHLKAAEGEWDIEEHLRHVHNVRKFWLSKFAPEFNVDMERLYAQDGDDWKPIGDLTMIRAELDKSAKQITLALKEKLVEPAEPNTFYDHPIFFLQHMVWHEGWHTGSILTTLRINGFERPEEWEEPNIWGVWRTE
jgi:uncharacterized damage-inducible protein DinB